MASLIAYPVLLVGSTPYRRHVVAQDALDALFLKHEDEGDWDEVNAIRYPILRNWVDYDILSRQALASERIFRWITPPSPSIPIITGSFLDVYAQTVRYGLGVTDKQEKSRLIPDMALMQTLLVDELSGSYLGGIYLLGDEAPLDLSDENYPKGDDGALSTYIVKKVLDGLEWGYVELGTDIEVGAKRMYKVIEEIVWGQDATTQESGTSEV